MKRRAVLTIAGLTMVLAVLPASGDDVRYGTLLGGGGSQDCETNLGCTPWADGTDCHPDHVLGHNNVYGHAYNLGDPTEGDKEVRFKLTEFVPAGYGPIEIVFHVRDATCTSNAPNTIFVPEAVNDAVTFLVPGSTKWMALYMAGTGSVYVAFEVSFDHCQDCAPPE